jgi:hypothetical protein
VEPEAVVGVPTTGSPKAVAMSMALLRDITELQTPEVEVERVQPVMPMAT